MSFLRNILKNRNFLRVERDKGSTTLWVVISHVDIPLGKFAQTGVFKDIPGNKVFLNCENNSWYQQGIPGFANSINELLPAVRQLAEEFKADELVFVGHSMGAYLSILLGMHNPGSFVFATSPEFVLNMPGSRSLRNNVQPDPDWASLFNCDRVAGNHVNGLVVLGVDDPIDAHFLANEQIYSGQFGTIVEAPYHHGVTEFFTSLGVYQELLKDPAKATHELENKTVLNAPFRNGRAEQYEHFYQTSLLLRGGNRRSPELVRRINTFPDWEHAGWQELRSKYFRSVGDFTSALDAAEMAFYIRPHLPQIAVEYGRACLANSRFTEVNHLVDFFRISNPKHPLYRQFFSTVKNSYALRDQNRLALGNRHMPAAGHGRGMESGFHNRNRSLLRPMKAHLQENDDDALFEQLAKLFSEDQNRAEMLRIAVRASGRHRLSWLASRLIVELAFQEDLTIVQLKTACVTALRMGRIDLIHRLLPRIQKVHLEDAAVCNHLLKALELTSEPTLIVMLCELLLDDPEHRLSVLELAESGARRSLNFSGLASYLLERLPEFESDGETISAITQICCRAGLRSPAQGVLMALNLEEQMRDRLVPLFPTQSDRATGE